MSPPTEPEMAADADIDLDHAGLIVPDLDAARARFAALGFTLTERADHTRTTPDGRTIPAGSSQHSIMLGRGYIELMQIWDPSAGHPLTPATQVRYGLHILALGTPDARAWHARCLREHVEVGPILDWLRPVSLPERSGLARFRFFDSPWQARDPSYVCWVQHLTPEWIRSPLLLTHPNTATALQGIAYRGPGAALAQWSARLRDCGARQGTDPGELTLGSQVIRLQADDSLTDVRPDALLLEVDRLAAFSLHAERAGIEITPLTGGGLIVDPGTAYGLRLEARARH
jgi:catechol 2,3-dioxygenase-like lactoylglutathione lyase family enzyme